MKNRKAYVRVSKVFDAVNPPIEVIAGVELDRLEPVSVQYDRLTGILERTLNGGRLRNYADDTIAEMVEKEILQRYGRDVSYFLEVGRGTMDEYVQVFQP